MFAPLLSINSIFSVNFSADYIKTCKIKEPGFVPCSTESIQMLFAQLATGNIRKCLIIKNGSAHD